MPTDAISAISGQGNIIEVGLAMVLISTNDSVVDPAKAVEGCSSTKLIDGEFKEAAE